MKSGWKGALGLVITAVLLWRVLRGVDPARLVEAIRGANYWLFGAAVVVTTLGFALRAARWAVLLHPVRRNLPFRSSFAATNIGYMANNLLPARIGELIRAYAISRMEPVPASAGLGAIVVEHVLDAFAVAVLLLVAVLAPDFPSDAQVDGRSIAWVLNWIGVALALAAAGVAALLLWPRRLVAVIERGAKRVLPERIRAPVVAALEAFLEGLSALRDLRLTVRAVLWSFALWHAFAFWLAFRAFGVGLSFFAALFANGIAAIVASIPAAPGFIGTFHYGVKESLHGVYGVEDTLATAFALVFHLGGFVPVTLIGLYYAWRVGFSLSEARRRSARIGRPGGGSRAPSRRS